MLEENFEQELFFFLSYFSLQMPYEFCSTLVNLKNVFVRMLLN